MGFAAPTNKNLLYASVAAGIIFIFALTSSHSSHAQRLTSAISEAAAHRLPTSWSTKAKPNEPNFYEVATHHGTDKVTEHSYHDMYDKYLPALRHQKIKMLEIGLGCDMVSIFVLIPTSSFYTMRRKLPVETIAQLPQE